MKTYLARISKIDARCTIFSSRVSRNSPCKRKQLAWRFGYTYNIRTHLWKLIRNFVVSNRQYVTGSRYTSKMLR